MRGGKYWEREEERVCRICEWEEETWEHVVEVCMREEGRGGRERVIEILEDDGRGEGWMRKVQELREGREREVEEKRTIGGCERERERRNERERERKKKRNVSKKYL